MPISRPAQIEDKEILGELLLHAQNELKNQRGGMLYLQTEVRANFSSLEADLKDPDSMLAVGVFENLVVGWGAVNTYQVEDGPKIGRITEIYVQPEARNIGVGEVVISSLLEWAKANGCGGIEGTALPGNREMKGIFERFGIKTRLLVLYKDL